MKHNTLSLFDLVMAIRSTSLDLECTLSFLQTSSSPVNMTRSNLTTDILRAASKDGYAILAQSCYGAYILAALMSLHFVECSY